MTMELTKTLGRRTSRLFCRLQDEGTTVFDLGKAAALMKVTRPQAAGILYAAGKRGLVTPVKRGLYNLVPFELGSTTFHLEDRYLLVRESLGDMQYFLSHASAFDIHQLATQPNFDVYVSSPRRRKNINLGGSLVHFVWTPAKRFFGYRSMKLGNTQLCVSDLERTLVDGVSMPAYCGGLVEVAKAFFTAKTRLDCAKLIKYARDYQIGAVLRRAGFLMELLKLADKAVLDELAADLPAGYVKLDPDLPAEGGRDPKWGLQLNVSREEIENALSH
jgi:predicted transcriptional regulator of viral defense system